MEHQRFEGDRPRFGAVIDQVTEDSQFGYCEAGSPRWGQEVESVNADVVLVGHTHVPAMRSFGSRVVVNPGSLGQRKTGSPEARYAVWRGGKFELKSCPYPVEEAVAKVQSMPIDGALCKELSTILQTGTIP